MVADSTFAAGTRVDRYEIRELIGEGGMGAIYSAVDTRLGRTVALKVVRADRLGSSTGEQVRQRFLREALAISRVEHRNVVRVLDFGFADDTPYLAMEYLRGRDLGKLVKASSDSLPIDEVVDVMLGVCAAIRACHDVGIIHRDLKPSNIFLCEHDGEREVKILDFGVSKAPMVSDLTKEGQIVGTPQYLAPEQLDGKALPQTDQYAIGVVLYACLTKSLPYQDHADLSLLRAIDVGKFARPRDLRSDLPEKLEEIILRAMQTAPEARFESVHALGRELWQFAGRTAREQWRSYYFDPRPSVPAKASAHAMPLVEAIARGIAADRPSSDTMDLPIVGATTPEVAAKPAAADVRTPTATSARAASNASAKRWTKVPLIAAVTLTLAGAGWWILGRPIGARPPQTVVPIAPLTTTAPVVPVPAAAPVSNVQAAPAPTPPDRSAAKAPTVESAAGPQPSTRAEKRSRRHNNRPTPEHTSDGVPIMP